MLFSVRALYTSSLNTQDLGDGFRNAGAHRGASRPGTAERARRWRKGRSARGPGDRRRGMAASVAAGRTDALSRGRAAAGAILPAVGDPARRGRSARERSLAAVEREAEARS